MRNTRWLRYGLASIVAAGTGLGATLVACGDDDPTVTPTTNPDTGIDAQVPDSSPAPDAAPRPNIAKLTIVNATTDMGPNMALNLRGDAAFRICFKQGTTAQNLSVAPYPPLPDKPKGGPIPGIFYGTGGTFPSFGLDLENRIIIPIIMNAKTLAKRGWVNPGNGQPGTTCDELVGDTADANSGLIENTDFWVLPQIDAGTFKKEKAYVLTLTGCVGDATIANREKCGANPPSGAAGPGNLAVKVYETTRTAVSATQLGIQFLHSSPQINQVFGPGAGNAAPLAPGFMSNPADAATFQAATPGPIVVNTLTPAQGVTGVKDTDYFVLNKDTPGNPTAGPLVPFPLVSIQNLSGFGKTVPTIYKDGKNYVVVLVGDVQEPTFQDTDGGCTIIGVPGRCGDGGDGTTFNTKSPHFIAFPTDPVIEAYKP